jgi:hypothetical protein
VFVKILKNFRQTILINPFDFDNFHSLLDNASNPRTEKFPYFTNGSIIPRLFEKGYLNAWKVDLYCVKSNDLFSE